ncbi:MAG TPA: CheR family methyltransferase [Bryobacteraceae bacterium]|nr:CheR family methyltransferase [Bryobacteraceae bacterium]
MAEGPDSVTPNEILKQQPRDPEAAPPVIGDRPEDEAGRHLLPYPIVAVGASAGGLEAYVEMLMGTPAKTGVAFALICHLAPEHESHLIDILSRHTPMPVSAIQHGLEPQPDHVYVLAPNQRVRMEEGKFRVEQRPGDERVPRPIDYFFSSLAADQKNRAVGVVLSGSDADGTLGLRAIIGEGGITIVQSPDSARFPEMPRSGIAADHVDMVLPPTRIGPEVARLGQQFSQPELRPLEDGRLDGDNEHHFGRMLTLLRGVAGIDFREYKLSTIRRRVARRMMLKRFDNLGEYFNHLKNRPEEVRELHEDVLIGVTRFFRDPEVFDALKKTILPNVFRARPEDEQVRVWVAGCSTGEEAYSIAICLLEHTTAEGIDTSIQIFGTDASERSIEKARTGTYPETISAEVLPERLRRFFTRVEHGYQVSKRLRDMCIFARQNLCTDPPFSRLDIASCRNVLVYLGAPIQKAIITTFHYALKPTGYLLLGASESLREHAELFTPVDRKHRLYAKVPGSRRTGLDLLPGRVHHEHTRTRHLPVRASREGWTDSELQRAVDRLVLARYAPSGVVINSAFDVLQVRGHTAPYLEMPPGTPNMNLLRLARPGLGTVVRDAIRKAMEENVPVQIPRVRVREDDAVHEITVEVFAVSAPSKPLCYVVLFVPAEEAVPAQAALTPEALAGTPDEKDRGILQVRQDLAATKMHLQALIEERDSRNHELTTAYEEAQSANEELQSSNEELETAKEELQSTNEELQTVNDELRNRNAALTRASNDLANLFNSVNVPLVMLGSDLTIRHFTPPSERLMSIRATDIGRPIREMRLNVSLTDIEPVLHEVMETLAMKELEVQDRDGRWNLLRIRPYRTSETRLTAWCC